MCAKFHENQTETVAGVATWEKLNDTQRDRQTESSILHHTMMCGGKYDMDLVANLLLSLTVKNFLNIGAYISQSYEGIWVVCFLWSTAAELKTWHNTEANIATQQRMWPKQIPGQLSADEVNICRKAVSTDFP